MSLVVATKDALPLLAPLLKSFARISPSACELIVIDGNSSDGTVAWLNDIIGPPSDAAQATIRWLSRADGGISEAWNSAVKMARGEWIVFLGADDRLAGAQAWATTLALLLMQPASIDGVALSVRMVSPLGRMLDIVQPRLGVAPDALPILNTLPHQGVFHRASLWRRFGLFDQGLRIAADYEFLLRVLSRGAQIVVVEAVSPVIMTFGGASKRHAVTGLLEMRRVQVRHGMPGPAFAWVIAMLRSATRQCALALLGRRLGSRFADAVRVAQGAPAVWTVE